MSDWRAKRHNIAAKLEDAGYLVGKDKQQRPGIRLEPSGLDVSKRTATSLFYAPVQAKNPEDSFFRYYNGPKRLLDPTVWIENNVIQFPIQFTAKDRFSNDQRQVDWDKVRIATEEWRQSRNYPGEGNARFWVYALALRASGMNLSDIETTLIEEATFARTPKERREQIPSIIASLKDSRRRFG